MTTTAVQKPIERFLPLLKGYRQYSRGYTARCPAHHDKSPSLMIWEDETDGHIGIKCHSGCSRKAICEALGITESSLYADDGQKVRGPSHPVITVMDLAVDKLIHPHFLERLGVRDDKRGVIIPYYKDDGTPYERYRIRTSLIAKQGSKWNLDNEAPLIPYGLQRLNQARQDGYLVIVEGESDCWTLWQHGIPALGVPGAENYKVLTREILTDIPKVYIVQEADPAGEKFAQNVEKHLKKAGYAGKLYKIDMHQAGVNDPNDLQKRDIKCFQVAFETLKNKSLPLFPIGKKPTVARLCDLQEQVLPDTRWAVPDLIPEGVTLLCGKPKLGKSWLLLAILIAVASGAVALGNIAVEQGEVLYISLEDKDKRLQKRANIVNQNCKVSDKFHYATSWPRLNEGGLEFLEEWIQEHPQVRLIGIDTWAKIKPKSHRSNGQQYEEDYDAIVPLQELAAKYQVSIVVVHHMRKTESEDPLDMVLGSTANTGAVDGFLLLYRKRGEQDARLFVTGRDIEEEQDLLLTFNQEIATWKIKGDSSSPEIATTPERQRIVDVLKLQPMSVKELAKRLGKNVSTTRSHLLILRNEGKVVLENNVYRLVTTSKASNTSKTSNTSNPPDLESEVTSPDYSLTSPLVTRLVTTNGLAEEPIEPLQNGHDEQVTSVTSLTSHNGKNGPNQQESAVLERVRGHGSAARCNTDGCCPTCECRLERRYLGDWVCMRCNPAAYSDTTMQMIRALPRLTRAS